MTLTIVNDPNTIQSPDPWKLVKDTIEGLNTDLFLQFPWNKLTAEDACFPVYDGHSKYIFYYSYFYI